MEVRKRWTSFCLDVYFSVSLRVFLALLPSRLFRRVLLLFPALGASSSFHSIQSSPLFAPLQSWREVLTLRRSPAEVGSAGRMDGIDHLLLLRLPIVPWPSTEKKTR